MHCPQCGAPNDQDAKFCVSCGTRLEQQAAAVTHTDNSTQRTNQFEDVQGEGHTNNQTNQYVSQGKEIGKGYLHFLPDALKRPYATSKQVTNTDQTNGIITIVLFALLLPLYAFVAANKVGSGLVQVPFFDVVLKPFFILLIFFAALIAIQYGISKLMNVDLTYMNVLTRFGTLMVVPTFVLVVAIFFLILSINIFSSILFFLSLAFVSISMIATLFSIKSQQTVETGLDVVYGIILTNIAIVIIMMIIGDSIIGNLMEQMNPMNQMQPGSNFYNGF
ncbi:zinc-ribbon domain-containing protein [Virgibacillus sp. MSP4-1]|uniref:zinc ribbon domain-containing protein n=1 Tax=Virgibacillus sp. MSP4-1 TaxID=2700081 RepID=UPI0003A94B69|nr:zinc ribbon domain-containing protein [Virgibacillus sp. MSP4-1]QHS23038.1 zinc-ribbon domain-containing protein [Virgibacillus sp. MSP4-1]